MFYIIRHGKTDWNVLHKLQGRTDVPLNDEGRQMAEAARAEYQDVHFDICFCSPLIRAKETAEILLKGRNIPILTDERLVEMGFGSYEGLENSFQIPDCPINELFFHPENYTSPPGGAESLDSLFARTGEFLRDIRKSYLPGILHSSPVDTNKSRQHFKHGAFPTSVMSGKCYRLSLLKAMRNSVQHDFSVI